MQRVIFYNERIFATRSERVLQRKTSDFLQRATSATNSEQNLQPVTSDFTTSSKQRVNINV